MSEQDALGRLGTLSPPSNKRRPWRVYGPGEDFTDHPSENKAYERVRELRRDKAVTVTVYQYENGRWYLFEHVED